MTRNKIVLAMGIVVLLYGAYRGASCLLRGDPERVRAVVDELTAGFKDGNAGAVLALLTKDFVVTHRNERVDRAQLVDYLNFTFFRQRQRIELRGGLDAIAIDGDKASATWEGTAVQRPAQGGGAASEMHRGSAALEFRKVDGQWLLASAEAVPAQEQ